MTNSDTLPTVWSADAHTFAKHAIVKRFLEAWFPVLPRQSSSLGRMSRNILYVDGFAGPGEYVGGEPGSPVIALNVALNHSLPVPAHFVFIEQREDRYRYLLHVIERQRTRITTSKNVVLESPRLGSCDEVLPAILDDHDRRAIPFAPALAFLDQFGYSAVSLDRKSTRLNSSHQIISYAVFCLKKKKTASDIIESAFEEMMYRSLAEYRHKLVYMLSAHGRARRPTINDVCLVA